MPRGLAFLVACRPCLCFPFLPPYPPTPFPGGEGGDSRLFHARSFAPCIPGAEPARHWERGRTTHPAGLAPALPVDLAAVVLAGGLSFGRLPTPPFVYFFAPYPPAPFPGGGRGRPRLFHARGFAPCLPGVEPARHWSRGRITHPAGGVPSLSPACPAFCFPFCPLPRRGRISPNPLPRWGRGDQG